MPNASEQAFIQQINSLSKEGLAISEEYRKISESYKKALIDNDLSKISKVTEKHQLAVDAFVLLDQQLQLVLQHNNLNNLKALSDKIANINNISLSKSWNDLKTSIQKNQNLNFELEILLQKNDANSKQILAILQGFNSPISNSSYDQKGKMSSSSSGRSFGSI